MSEPPARVHAPLRPDYPIRSHNHLWPLLPDRPVLSAVGREWFSVPASPPFAQGHSSNASHQVEFGWPHEPVGHRVDPSLAIGDPVVMRDSLLGHNINLIEAKVRWIDP